jgi:hypothetical protein
MPPEPTELAETAEDPRGATGLSGATVGPPEHEPVTSLHDPRALQILSTEHWSLLSARSLAYNEAFTRGGMFLAFLSTSFVALALVAQAVPIDAGFLVVVAIVLAFDLVVGLTTYGRIIGANSEDYRAVHGMARIRHGYGEIAPIVLPYFTGCRRSRRGGCDRGVRGSSRDHDPLLHRDPSLARSQVSDARAGPPCPVVGISTAERRRHDDAIVLGRLDPICTLVSSLPESPERAG